jgi:hypothetical protein
MLIYIPEALYRNAKNKNKVGKILNAVPDTSLRISGLKTLDKAIGEIHALGEDRIAEFISQNSFR